MQGSIFWKRWHHAEILWCWLRMKWNTWSEYPCRRVDIGAVLQQKLNHIGINFKSTATKHMERRVVILCPCYMRPVRSNKHKTLARASTSAPCCSSSSAMSTCLPPWRHSMCNGVYLAYRSLDSKIVWRLYVAPWIWIGMLSKQIFHYISVKSFFVTEIESERSVPILKWGEWRKIVYNQTSSLIFGSPSHRLFNSTPCSTKSRTISICCFTDFCDKKKECKTFLPRQFRAFPKAPWAIRSRTASRDILGLRHKRWSGVSWNYRLKISSSKSRVKLPHFHNVPPLHAIEAVL